MRETKLTKVRGLVTAVTFVFLIVAPSVMAASPKIEEVFVDFVAETITIVGSGFTDDLEATLGQVPGTLTFESSVLDSTMVFELPDVPDRDYLLTLSPSSFSCRDGKPTSLFFEYTGLNCGNFSNMQGDKASCEDPGSGPGTGAVEIFAAKGKSKKGGFTVTPSIVSPGDKFTIESGKGGRLSSTSRFEIVEAGEVVQVVTIHTSCSRPLETLDSFGSLTLVSGTAKGAGGVATYDLTIDRAGGGGTGSDLGFYTNVNAKTFSGRDMVTAHCDSEDDATGGGYEITFAEITDHTIFLNRPFESSGWSVDVDVWSKAKVEVYVVCADTH